MVKSITPFSPQRAHGLPKGFIFRRAMHHGVGKLEG